MFLTYLFALNGRGYPWVVVFFMLAIVLYQLASGTLFNLRWGVWIHRKESPRLYWKVFAIEAAIILIFICVGVITLTSP